MPHMSTASYSRMPLPRKDPCTMFIPSVLIAALSLLVLAAGLMELFHAMSLTHDRNLLLQSMRRRTGRTMGTVIGGSALTYGERLTCPLVRFEVDGKECLATGPVLDAVTRGREKGINGATLLLSETEMSYINAHSKEFVRAIDALRETERNGEHLRERWDLAYQGSVFSDLYPIDSKVAVAYDETYPETNNMVLLPDGSDQPLITGHYVRMTWGRTAVEIMSGCVLLIVSMALWTGHIVMV